jgi:hypothetical protein
MEPLSSNDKRIEFCRVKVFVEVRLEDDARWVEECKCHRHDMRFVSKTQGNDQDAHVEIRPLCMEGKGGDDPVDEGSARAMESSIQRRALVTAGATVSS